MKCYMPARFWEHCIPRADICGCGVAVQCGSTSLRTMRPLHIALARGLEIALVSSSPFCIAIERTSYGNHVARPALRRANVVEEARLYLDCCADIGARHRCEYGYLQC